MYDFTFLLSDAISSPCLLCCLCGSTHLISSHLMSMRSISYHLLSRLLFVLHLYNFSFFNKMSLMLNCGTKQHACIYPFTVCVLKGILMQKCVSIGYSTRAHSYHRLCCHSIKIGLILFSPVFYGIARSFQYAYNSFYLPINLISDCFFYSLLFPLSVLFLLSVVYICFVAFCIYVCVYRGYFFPNPVNIFSYLHMLYADDFSIQFVVWKRVVRVRHCVYCVYLLWK